MGFWDDLENMIEDSLKGVNSAARDAQKKKQEELKDNLAGLGTHGDREQEVDRLISDPNALNSFSLQELEHQRLTAQSELDRIQGDIGKQEAKLREMNREPYLVLTQRLKRSFANGQAEKYKAQARKRTLLIGLIEAKKNEPKRPAPPPPSVRPPNPEETRTAKKAEILAMLEALPVEEQKMVATTNDEAMKRRIQNMYAQKRTELMEELSKWI
jgi:hypothetical protein